jgi:HK97 family phage major capsid protein
MTRETYLNKRNALINEAQSLIDKGDMKGYTAKENEIRKLDEDFEAQSTAQANLNALNGSIPSKAAEFYANKAEPSDDFGSLEYRKAFMNYVAQRTPIPDNFSNAFQNVTTSTGDVSPVIPTTVLNRIVEKMENIGTVLNLVTRTNYKGGLTIPTSTVKPTATWVNEGAGVTIQKSGVDGTITFTYHKLKIAVSMTLEVSVMSLSAFETKFVNDVAGAMVKALEQAIISGSGTDRPKGILAETPASGQAISIASGTALDYAVLIAMEAALPSAYENGAVYAMTKKTFMAMYGITDDNGQPIARINYGISGKPERSILGREVVILDDYISNYTKTVTADTTVAFIFNFADYILNTNYEITAKVYEDNDTDDLIRKAVMITDGKVVDKNSLVTLTVTA